MARKKRNQKPFKRNQKRSQDTASVTAPLTHAPRPLTERELAIVRLIAKGCIDKEIASELGLRPPTIVSNLRVLYAKYGVSRRAALVYRLASELQATGGDP